MDPGNTLEILALERVELSEINWDLVAKYELGFWLLKSLIVNWNDEFPVAPVPPVDPVGPVEPVGPVDPVGPVEPVGPIDPV